MTSLYLQVAGFILVVLWALLGPTMLGALLARLARGSLGAEE